MKNSSQVVRCCRKKLRKGRSLFSQAVDYIALRGLIFMLCCMWFGANIANDAAKVLLSIVTTVFISAALDLINSLRLDSLIKKERSLAAKDELNRRISLLSEEELNVMIGRHIAAHREHFGRDKLICHVSRASGASADDVIKAAREARRRGAGSVALFHSGGVSSDAGRTALSLEDIPFEFIHLPSALGPEELKAHGIPAGRGKPPAQGRRCVPLCRGAYPQIHAMRRLPYGNVIFCRIFPVLSPYGGGLRDDGRGGMVGKQGLSIEKARRCGLLCFCYISMRGFSLLALYSTSFRPMH